MVANRNALKSYAPQARKDFIQAMINRAALFGITKAGATPGEARGDLYLIKGRAYPRAVAGQRSKLLARVAATSFDQTMEAVAYTWFNRCLAIRYMELHGYFEHGYRVLSHPAGDAEPEILQHAQHLTLPGLDRDMVVALKLDGAQDEVLYRRILIAQCNDLHRAMPFLFERIDDETELLLPENLLQSDSIVRKLVGEIDETEWNEIEIIGWLYQFYISEKKDQVIGKVVKSEDIPAATQLFTPNWIVKYMVQNSLGAQWLATYPASPLKASLEYYVVPNEQTPEVQAQLAAITPESLDPEAITLIDPAVGSGHILVEAYDLFRSIYLERGYTPQEAARAILTKNLYGLDIDDRAAQLAGFALLMKARADDRTLMRDTPTLNVRSLVDSGGWDSAAMADALCPARRVELVPPSDLMPETLPQPTLAIIAHDDGPRAAIDAIVRLFDGAKTFGSLTTVPDAVLTSLEALEALLAAPDQNDLLQRQAHGEAKERLASLVAQARLLGRRYNCVAANPPYMGASAANSQLKRFLSENYKAGRMDLYSSFILRCQDLSSSFFSMVVQHGWMFLSRFQELRLDFVNRNSIVTLLHLGPRAFDSISGEVVQSAVFSARPVLSRQYAGIYFDLTGGASSEKKSRFINRSCHIFVLSQDSFSSIPGSVFAYWASDRSIEIFKNTEPLEQYAKPRHGMVTSDNGRFLREWAEIDIQKFNPSCQSRDDAIRSRSKWFPYNKGGGNRRWYGHNEIVVNWENDGEEIISFAAQLYGSASRQIQNTSFYFKRGLTWSSLSAESIAMRSNGIGFLFDSKGNSMFFDHDEDLTVFLALCNSDVAGHFMRMLAPTLDFNAGAVGKMPVIASFAALRHRTREIVERAVSLAKEDWDAYETSWDFRRIRVLDDEFHRATPMATLVAVRAHWQGMTEQLQRLEQANNRLFIEAYGLADDLTPEVPLSEITLTCNPLYRYGGDITDDEREIRLRADTFRELISYAIGVMMGRYSLVEPGLIYAHAADEGFDPSRYGAFPADEDGIVAITEDPWFSDDAANRLEEFLQLVWPQAPIGETLATAADALTQGKGDEPRAALRAYLAKSFYKDHLQTYRNRPIYWLFSSGKLKAFECLVYIHRYNESTLARMRTAYVTPLMGKMQQRVSDLDGEIVQSTSSSEKTRKGREKERVARQLAELRTFDEELRHVADQRIPLDLDDGVKVNYGRFGDLLAAKDKVCGKADDKDE